MSVRLASPNDAAAIAACLAAAFEPFRNDYTTGAFKDTVSTPPGIEQRFREMTMFVAEDAGEAVGTIACGVLKSGEGHLRGMAVRPGFQGSGVAERLLSAAEDHLRIRGCTRVTLGTTQYLRRAIQFYLRHGYEATGVVNDFFGMALFEYAKRFD